MKNSDGSEGHLAPAHLVLDFRRAQIAPHSGVGRYVQGLAEGISEALGDDDSGVNFHVAVSKDSATGAFKHAKLVHWGRSDSLVFEKPRFLWATLCLKRFAKNRKAQRIVWIAPDNIDRPLSIVQVACGALANLLPSHWVLKLEQFFSGWFGFGRQLTIVQIVHDVIPILFPSRTSVLLRLQMRFFFGFLRQRNAKCIAISASTRSSVRALYPKVDMIDSFLTPRLDKAFTQALRSCLHESRDEIIEGLCRDIDGFREAVRRLPITKSVLFLGVGRDEPYKRWKLVPSVLDTLAQQSHANRDRFVFIHVCPDRNQGGNLSLALYDSKDADALCCSDKVTIFPALRTIRLSAIHDRSLARLYRLVNCLIHPSACEGFGFPIGEAYLAGLPAIFLRNCGFSCLLPALHDHGGLFCIDELRADTDIAGYVDLQTDNNTQFSARAAVSSTRLASENVAEQLLGWERVGAALLRLVGRSVK